MKDDRAVLKEILSEPTGSHERLIRELNKEIDAQLAKPDGEVDVRLIRDIVNCTLDIAGVETPELDIERQIAGIKSRAAKDMKAKKVFFVKRLSKVAATCCICAVSSVLLLILFLLTTFFYSCKNNEQVSSDSSSLSSAYNPFDIGNKQPGGGITQAEFSWGIDGDVKQLVYNGKSLEFDYFIDNGSVECEVGIIVIIDGIPHQYSTDSDNNQAYIHSFELKENTKKKFKIFVKPVVGKSGDTLLLNTASVLNPSFVPDPSKIEYGNNYSICEGGYIPVRFEQDSAGTGMKSIKADKVTEIPQRIIDELKKSGNDIEKGVDPHLYFDNMKPFDDSDKIDLTDSDRLQPTLNGFGGSGATYRIFVFADKKVIPLADGSRFVEMEYLPDKLTCIDIAIDKSMLEQGSSLYAVAFPVLRKIDYEINAFPKRSAVYYIHKK